MKTASVKAKGRSLQQTVRDKILDAFPRLEKDDVVSTSMGAGGEDIKLSPAARRSFPFSVEAKSRATISTYKWYDQAVANAGSGVEPLLVIKANRRKPLVVMDLDAFMDIVK
jgi:hypothetical protein